MRTLGELEAAVCERISRFEQDYMGRGPKDIHTHLLGDLLVVRLRGVLTAAEQHLVKSLSAEKGRELLKQVRTHLIETARPVLEAIIQEVAGVKVLSLHHDISTVTGEEVVLFSLAELPDFVERKQKADPKPCQVGRPSPRAVFHSFLPVAEFRTNPPVAERSPMRAEKKRPLSVP
jgi:uncharacterized protein YbcI